MYSQQQTEKRKLHQDLALVISYIQNHPRNFSKVIRAKHPGLWNKVDSLTNASTWSENAYLYVQRLSQAPQCYCGSRLEFLSISRGYRQYCSRKCTANSNKSSQKTKRTCLELYGVDHFSKTDEYKKKFKSTCLDRYGVENPGQITDNLELRARQKQMTFWKDKCAKSAKYATPLFSFDEYKHVRQVMPWKCKKCSKSFPSHVFNRMPKCPVCYPTAQYGGQSTVEKSILTWLKTWYTGTIIENDRTKISPKELDIYFPEVNVAIEVCGLYWHSTQFVPPSYHRDKFLLCRNNDIDLLTIYDSEWQTQTVKWKKIITQRLKNIHEKQCFVFDLRQGIPWCWGNPDYKRRALIEQKVHTSIGEHAVYDCGYEVYTSTN